MLKFRRVLLLPIVFFTIVFVVCIILVFIDDIKKWFSDPITCPGSACVRFCCPYENSCTSETNFTINGSPGTEKLSKEYGIIKGLPCEDLHPHEEFEFKQNGYVTDSSNYTYHWGEYCYHISDDDGEERQVLTCPPINYIENVKSIYPWLMILSIPFLILTAIFIYARLKLRVLHANLIMGYIVSLILMYTLLSIIGLYNHAMLTEHNTLCRAMGYSFMVAIFMCFFWLNAMCFDVWRMIRNPRSEEFKFSWYCLYAFGTPIALVLLAVFFNELELLPDGWRTYIGIHSCSISDPLLDRSDETLANSGRAQLLYLYGPIMLFLTINIGLYVATFTTIYREKHNERNDEHYQRLVEREKPRFNIYLWFCVLMTLIWCIEIISWLMDGSVFLYIASIINCLQGFIIFFMFVCRDDKLVELKPPPNHVELSEAETRVPDVWTTQYGSGR